MSTTESSTEIDEAAASWAGRALFGRIDGAVQSELDEWLGGDRRRAGAFLKAQAVLASFDPQTADVEKIAPTTPSQWSRRRAIGGALAASIVVATGIGGWWQFQPQILETGIGDIRSVALADGSSLTLDAMTRVSVRLLADRRLIALERGRALFNVAHDAGRPFVVQADGVEVTAIGTSFSVDAGRGRRPEVIMREGVVEVRGQGLNDGPVRLTAQQRLIVTPSDGPRITSQSERASDDALAWHDGFMVLDQTTLADAADRFARYSNYRIDVDPSVADLRVTGRFAAADARGFATSAALGLSIRAQTAGDRVRLTK